MLSNEEYEILISSWKNQYGVEYVSKKSGNTYIGVPKNQGERREMIHILVSTLVQVHGYTESDFGQHTKNKIVEACVFSDYKNKEALRAWRASVYSDLIHVLGNIFKKEFVKIEIKQENRPRVESGGEVEQTDREIGYDTYHTDYEVVELKNPLNMDIFKEVPESQDVIDEEFMAMIASINGKK